MSNDDLSLSDLSPNIIDSWEHWASDRPDRETKQTSTERQVIALCRAVRVLRSDLAYPFCQRCGGSGLRLWGWLDCRACGGRGRLHVPPRPVRAPGDDAP